MSNIQETYRGLIRDLYVDGEGITDISEDILVSVCCAFYEMNRDSEKQITEAEVFTALEFMDHLHTQGRRIR